jgi:hypothetical protein
MVRHRAQPSAQAQSPIARVEAAVAEAAITFQTAMQPTA